MLINPLLLNVSYKFGFYFLFFSLINFLAIFLGLRC